MYHLGDDDGGCRDSIHLYRRGGRPVWLKCRVSVAGSVTVDVEDPDLFVLATAIDAKVEAAAEGSGALVPLCRCNGPSRPPSLRIKLDPERTAYFRTVADSSSFYYTRAPPPGSVTELAGCGLLLNVELTPMWRMDDGSFGVSMLATEVLYRPPPRLPSSHILVPRGGAALHVTVMMQPSPDDEAVALDSIDDI